MSEWQNIGESMIEHGTSKKRKILKRVSGKIKSVRKKWHEENVHKRKMKKLFKIETRRLEPKYIKQRAAAKLKEKYTIKMKMKAKKRTKIGWQLPQPGQRTVGQNIFDAMAGKHMKGKVSKKK